MGEPQALPLADRMIVHQCPPRGSGIMPCCDRTPFEVDPFTDAMASDVSLVTCGVVRLPWVYRLFLWVRSHGW